ncbi:DUF445 domain-containing protein [Oecophyllibacter saccharovorans]|nr:DUF445 domain-containing protein [Oecophyllibacter saccharovorans]
MNMLDTGAGEEAGRQESFQAGEKTGAGKTQAVNGGSVETVARKIAPGKMATLLLAAMGGLAVGASLPLWQRLYGNPLWLDMLRSGTQAGVVGGLADWFAVTALFRHPLGLPIPHTAILPRRKAELGEALGNFIVRHFFTDEDVGRLLQGRDFSRMIAQALARPETFASVSTALRSVIPGLCERLEDGRSAAAFKEIFPQLLAGVDLNPLLMRGMRAMVDEDVHQEVFSFFLAQFKELVLTREGDVRDFVAARVREQGGRFVGWALGGTVANQVLGALKMELDRVDPMDSELRHGFTGWVRDKINLLADEPDRSRELMQDLGRFLSHDSLREWGGGLWQRLRTMALEDSARTDGWCAQACDILLQQFISALEQQGPLARKINQTLVQGILRLMPGIRKEIAVLIPRVVQGWDGEGLSRRLEAGLGRDLAYIRVNGTVVGFLIGAALEGLLGGLLRS